MAKRTLRRSTTFRVMDCSLDLSRAFLSFTPGFNRVAGWSKKVSRFNGNSYSWLTYLVRREKSARSARQHKARGVSPGIECTRIGPARGVGDRAHDRHFS